MKLNKFINSLIMAVLLLSLGACREELFDDQGHWNGKVPDELTVTLVIPDPQEVKIGTRDTDPDLLVDRLNVICYDSQGKVLSNEKLTEDNSDWVINNNTITVTLSLAGDQTARVDVIANSEDADLITKDSKKTPDEILANQQPTDKAIFWGSAPIEPVITDHAMPMIRNAAMLTIDNEATETFELLEMGVFGTYDSGTLAPTYPTNGSTILPTAPTIHNDSEMLGVVADSEVLTSDKVAEIKQDLIDRNLYKAWSATDNAIERIYETEAGDLEYKNGELTGGKNYVRVIVRGTYTDPSDGTAITGYYVVALCERSEMDGAISEHPGDYTYGNALPILRNHKYMLKITDVRGDGWKTLGQAMTALPDNRITVMCEDKSPNVTDIEASRDYYLGVSGNLTVNYNENATIDITTSYPGLNNGSDDWNTWKKRLSFENEDEDDWIDITNITADKPANYSANTLEMKVTISLTKNLTSRARYGTVKVRAGKLTREISITQLGCPYNRRRTVTLEGITKAGQEYPINDYLSFLDGKKYNSDGTVDENAVVPEILQGVSTADNRNVSRTGLHFPLVPLYDYDSYVFKIPKRDTDGTPKFVNNSGSFEYSISGDYYIVKLSDAAKAEIKSSSDIFRIPTVITDDETGAELSVNVDYNVFRTGIIHYLEPSSASNNYPQPDDASVQKSGWFYYDIARVGDVLILDRNLGATTSKAYSPGATRLKGNKGAIGGYFKVNYHRWTNYNSTTEIQTRREDQETITSQLHLSSSQGKFVPATEADYLSMNITVADGAVQAPTTTSRIPERTIYFPKAGYYEGDEFKSPSHCLLWTRTYLGGTQGLGPDAPEYGYWYRYYDDMKSSNPTNRFSNQRMARGSSGMDPDESSLWRYMPLRLVWVDNNCRNTNGGTVQEQEVISNKMIIYFENTQNWSDIKIYGWNMPGISDSYANPSTMTKVEGTDNLYRIETTGLPTNSSSGIQIRYNNNEGTTWNYEDFYSTYRNDESTVFYLKPGVQRTQNDINNNTYTRWTLICTEATNVDTNGNGGGGGGDDPIPTPTITYKYYVYGNIWNGSSWTENELTEASGYKLTDQAVSAGQFQLKVQKYENGTASGNAEIYTFQNPTLNSDINYGNYGANWTLSAGTYTFELNPTSKTLKVTQNTTPVTVRDIYLVGEMTDPSWGLDTSYKFSSTDGLTYTLTKKIEAGKEFKIWTGAWHDATTNPGKDWGISNGSDLENGTYTTAYGGGNISLKYGGDAVTLKLVFSSASDNSPKLTISGQVEQSGGDDLPSPAAGSYRIYWKKGIEDNNKELCQAHVYAENNISSKDATQVDAQSTGDWYYYDVVPSDTNSFSFTLMLKGHDTWNPQTKGVSISNSDYDSTKRICYLTNFSGTGQNITFSTTKSKPSSARRRTQPARKATSAKPRR